MGVRGTFSYFRLLMNDIITLEKKLCEIIFSVFPKSIEISETICYIKQ